MYIYSNNVMIFQNSLEQKLYVKNEKQSAQSEAIDRRRRINQKIEILNKTMECNFNW